MSSHMAHWGKRLLFGNTMQHSTGWPPLFFPQATIFHHQISSTYYHHSEEAWIETINPNLVTPTASHSPFPKKRHQTTICHTSLAPSKSRCRRRHTARRSCNMAMGHVSDLPINSVSSAFGSQRFSQIWSHLTYLPTWFLGFATSAATMLIFVRARVIEVKTSCPWSLKGRILNLNHSDASYANLDPINSNHWPSTLLPQHYQPPVAPRHSPGWQVLGRFCLTTKPFPSNNPIHQSFRTAVGKIHFCKSFGHLNPLLSSFITWTVAIASHFYK